MDKQLHVVQGKLLNIVPEMIFLIHSLQKSQGSSPDLEKNPTTPENEKVIQVERRENFTDYSRDMSKDLSPSLSHVS